jgi:hypothetical protein
MEMEQVAANTDTDTLYELVEATFAGATTGQVYQAQLQHHANYDSIKLVAAVLQCS